MRRKRDPESTLSRFLDLLLACHPATTTTGTYIPGDESRPTERGRERSPLDATPVGLAVASRTKTPCAQPPPSLPLDNHPV